MYLTSVMDLYSRKIISWVLSETLEASHVVECIEKAKRVRNVERPLIFHRDYAEEKTIPKISLNTQFQRMYSNFST